jgi:hypothetical protein
MSSHSLLRYLRRLRPAELREILQRDHVIRRAETYVQEGRVQEIWLDGECLRAHVSGSSSTPYHSVLRLHDGVLEPECSCPYTRGPCWHAGATLLLLSTDDDLMASLERQAERARPVLSGPPAGELPGTAAPDAPPGEAGLPEVAAPGAAPPVDASAAVSEIAERLLPVPKARLVEFVAQLAAQDPVVQGRLGELTAEPLDLDLRLYAQAVRGALRPGRRLGRWEAPRVAADLDEIVRAVLRVATGGHPERALDLVEEIAWAAWGRLVEADDRDAALLDFVRRTLSAWVRAWADVPGRDRQRLARQIYAWITEDAGGATGGLVREAAPALEKPGLAALEELLAPALEVRRDTRAGFTAAEEDAGVVDPVESRLRAALREAAEVRGDVERFLALCDTEGRDGAEILAAARRLAREADLPAALRCADQGRARARGSARAELDHLRIELLVQLDRRREAHDAAWEAFLTAPGAASYHRLLRIVDPDRRAEWRQRALDTAEAAAGATSFVEICLAADETERMLHRLETSERFVLGAGATVLDEAAQRLAHHHPEVAAHLQLHLADRILAAGDPRAYPQARRHLERARSHLVEHHGESDWAEEVARLRRAHPVTAAWFESP